MFDENFTPVWMQRQQEVEQIKLDSFKEAMKVETDFKWRQEAYRVVRKISHKCRGFEYEN